MENQQKFNAIIKAYESNNFGDMGEFYNDLKASEKRKFIGYCETEEFYSVISTLLEYFTI